MNCHQSFEAEADVYDLLDRSGVIDPNPLAMVSVEFDQGAAVAHTENGIDAIFWREAPAITWAQNGFALMWTSADRPPAQPSTDMLVLLDGCLTSG